MIDAWRVEDLRRDEILIALRLFNCTYLRRAYSTALI